MEDFIRNVIINKYQELLKSVDKDKCDEFRKYIQAEKENIKKDIESKKLVKFYEHYFTKNGLSSGNLSAFILNGKGIDYEDKLLTINKPYGKEIVVYSQIVKEEYGDNFGLQSLEDGNYVLTYNTF